MKLHISIFCEQSLYNHDILPTDNGVQNLSAIATATDLSLMVLADSNFNITI